MEWVDPATFQSNIAVTVPTCCWLQDRMWSDFLDTVPAMLLTLYMMRFGQVDWQELLTGCCCIIRCDQIGWLQRLQNHPQPVPTVVCSVIIIKTLQQCNSQPVDHQKCNGIGSLVHKVFIGTYRLLVTLWKEVYGRNCCKHHLHPVGHGISCGKAAKRNHWNATHLLLMVWCDETTFLKTCAVTHPLFVMDLMWLCCFCKVHQPCSPTIWCKKLSCRKQIMYFYSLPDGH
jgi:hypothetical protein